MTQLKKPKKLKLPFRKSGLTGSTSKAYMRNFGKGQIEYADDTLKFYSEKGLVAKRKEVVKKIPFADIESIILEKKELTVTGKSGVERFVVENVALAQLILEKANEFRSLKEKSTEEQIAVSQATAAITINTSLSVVDSLFDILRSLQGRIEWKLMNNYLRQIEKDLTNPSDKKTGLEQQDFSLLSSAINDHNVELISKESYRLLESIYSNFEKAPSGDESDQEKMTQFESEMRG